MKETIVSIIIVVMFSANSFAFDHSYTNYRTLLAETVDNGLVDYKKMKNDSQLLQNALLDFSEVSTQEYESFSRSEKIAYMLNAYNMYTLEGITNAYPVKSIKKIRGFWNKAKHKIAGEMMTLDNIEHDNLRKKFKEERVHVTVVCASISCPELWNKPFTPDSLEQQLTARSQSFATDITRNQINFEKEELKLSKILDWYGKDFIPKYSSDAIFPYLYDEKRAVANFIYQHLPKEMQTKLQHGKFKIGYLSYDWGLNEQ